ncbi:T9SS type B sorting domain-containing protein [Parvicella tangerina]|nr:gliding motility-associated C-terminal domain-containing protein [Parvicella tangerina]
MKVLLSLVTLLGLTALVRAQQTEFYSSNCTNGGVTIDFEVQVTSVVDSSFAPWGISCNGACDASIEITVNGGGGGPYGFELYDGSSTITQAADTPGGGTVATFSGLCADNYNVTVIDSAQVIFGSIFEECTRGGINIQNPDLIYVNVLGFANPSCPDSCDGQIFANIGGGTPPLNVEWYDINDNLISTANSPSGVCTGPNYVVVSDGNGCAFDDTVTVEDPIQINFGMSVQDVSCDGICDAQATSTPSGSNGGPYNFTWTDVSTSGGLGGASGLPSHTVGALCENQQVLLELEDVNGCPFDTTITIPDVLPMTLTEVSTTDATCFNTCDGSITISIAGGSGNYTQIEWFEGTIASPVGSHDAGPSLSQNDLCPNTDYFVTVTDDQGCTRSFQLTPVNAPTALVLTVDSTNVTCNGDGNGDIDITLVGGTPNYNFTWSYLIPGSGLVVNNEDQFGLSGGVYRVVYEDALGCTDSADIEILEPEPIFTNGVLTNVSCFDLLDGAIDVTTTGGNGGYVWTWTSTPNGNIVDPSLEDQTGLDSAVYSLNIVDVLGCSYDTIFDLTKPGELFFDAVVTDMDCFGDNDAQIALNPANGVPNYIIDWGNPINQNNGPTSQSGLSANTYDITLTDNNGCDKDTSIVINEPPLLTLTENSHSDVTCFAFDDGTIDVAISGGTAPTTLVWSGGSTAIPNDDTNPTGLGPGTYDGIVTDANGCTDNVSITIIEPAALDVDMVGSDLPCNGVATGSVDITASGGPLGTSYTYDWDTDVRGDFDDTEDISSLLAGTYCVNIQDDNGCTLAADSCVTIIEPDSIFFNGSLHTDITCNGDDDGTISLTVSGGTEAGLYDYTWTVPGCESDPGNVDNANNLCPGTYDIVATDDNGCTNDTTFTITEPNLLTISETHVNLVCADANTGSINITVSGGIAPTTVTWTSTTTTTPVADDLNPTNLEPGDYTATVTDANGCSEFVDITITTPPPLSMTISGTDLTCNGVPDGTITIVPTGGTISTDYDYSWSGPNGFSSIQQNLTNLLAGTYCVNITDDNGCVLTPDSCFTIIEPDSIFFDGSTFTDMDCFSADNGAISLSVSGGTESGTYDFIWGPIPGCATNPGNTDNASGLCDGSYTIQAIDDNGCTNDTTFTVTEPPQITLVLDSVDAGCGLSNGEVSVTPSGGTVAGGYGISWSGATAGFIGTNLTETGLDPDTYTVVVTDDNGCTATDNIEVITDTPPTITIDNVTDLICNSVCSGAIQTTITSSNPPNDIQWVGITDPTFSSTSGDLFNLCAGDYSLTVTDANLCSAVETVTISEPSPLELSNSVVTDVNCFGADNGVIDITAVGGTVSGGYTYTWTSDISFTSSSEDISSLAPGNYCVNIEDDNGCTMAADSCFTITEPTELVIDALTATDSQCGVPNGSATVTASGGTVSGNYGYLWDDGAAQTTSTATGLINNAYTVIVSDDNGCTVSGTVAVNPTNGPAVTIDGSTDVSCSGSNNGSISVTGSGGTGALSFTWTTADGSGLVPTDEDQTGLSGGTYVVTVTDGALCNSQEVIVIDEPDPLVIAAAVTDATCFGDNGEIDVTVSGGTIAVDYGYDWSYNGSGSYIDPEDATQPAGTYSLNVIDDNGCPASAGPFTINEPTAISLTTSSTVSACTQATGSVSVVATDGTPGNPPNEYSYIWTDAGGTQIGNSTTVTNQFSGCYDVEVTDANGCIATTTECISDNPGPTLTELHTDVTCNGGADGDIDLTVTSTALPVSVTWSALGGSAINPTVNDEDINGLAADEYAVTATDNNGCTAALSIVITEPNAVNIDAVVTNPLCASTMDGAIDITVNDANSPFSVVSWTGPNGFTSSSEDISGLEVGQYCLHLEDANSCSLDTCITLSAPTGVSVATSSVDSDCSAPTGQVSAVASGGNPGYSYEWFSDAGLTTSIGLGDTQTGLAAGIYYVEATDLNGCTGSASEEVFESGAPTITIDATNDVDCFGNSTGDIFITVSGGTPNYTFDWDNLPGANDPEDLTGVSAGTYNITVTDAAGCSDVDGATIAEPAAALAISGVQTDLTCNGVATGEVTITVTGGTTNYTYEWAQSGNLISSTTDGTGINTVTGLSAQTYDVFVTDANGCTITDQYTLNEPSAISLTMNSVGSSCGNADGEVSVAASGGTDGVTYTYDWDIDGTGDNDDNATETGLAAATYTVTVTDLNGCTSTDQVAVSDVGGPTVVGTASSVNCYGDANGTIDVTVTGNPTFDFAWTGPNGFTSTSEDLTGLEAGTYTLGTTDINGCITNEIFDVTGPIAPLSATLDSTDLTCFEDLSGAINLNPAGGTSPYQFSWTGPNGFTATTEDLNSLEAGTYTVDITDDNGCTLLGNTIDVVQPDSIEITFVTIDPSCGLSDGTVSATVVGGTAAVDYTYTWTDLGVPSVMPDIDADITGIGAGNYQLDITDDNGCTATDVIAVSNDQAPSISVVATDVTCNGDADGTIDITVNGTNIYTYDWDNNGTGMYTDPEDLSGLAPGTYNVEVLEDPTGCISSATATIVEPDVLDVTGTGTDLACFGDGSGAIDITVTGGTTNYTFDWDNDGTGDNDDNEDLSGQASGAYQVTVTDANGCIAIDSYTLTEPAQIGIAAIVTDNLCNGETNGAIDVTVSNGVLPYQYNWDLPSTNEDLSNLGAGTYTLTVTDGNTCTEDSTFTITEPAAIIFDVTTADANCTFSDGSATSNVSGGTLTSPDYTYDWEFGGSSIATTADITNQPAGTYIFFVTDDNMCQEDTTVIINNINAPTITLDNVSDVTCFGDADGSIDVTVSGGTAPYNYIWNPSGISMQEDLTNAPADTYTLQVTDDAGCITTLAGIDIDSPDELSATAVSVDATCGICNGEATVSGTGGTGGLSYLWSNGASGTNTTGLCAGIYTVEITDGNGCTVNQDVTINDNGGPTGENLTTTDVTCAGDNDGTAFVEAIGGTAPYSYFWPHDGSTGDTQSNLGAGTYNVEMIDDNGCIRVVPVDILEPTPIDITSVVTPSTCGNADGAITITTSGGVSPLSINWINPSGPTTPGVSGLSAGVYTVEVSDANLCTVTENITISDINAPSVTLSPSDVLCNGDASGSITSSVSGAVGALSYQWYDATPSMLGGETNPDILAVSTGDYTLEVTDAGTGCITNASATINEPDALVLSVPNTVDASCNISCDGEATAIVSGGSLAYNYTWSTGSNSATATNLCAGLNTVTITDDNGCIIQSSVMIDTNFTLTASVTPTDATCGDCNGAATVSPSGGSGTYDVIWSDGTNALATSGLCSGLYPFEVTDATTGCSLQMDATINDIGGPTGETLSITDVTCNGGSDGGAVVTPAGGTTPYDYNWVGIANSTNTLSNVNAGNYTLQVIDDNGCMRNVPVSIAEPDPIDIQYIATDGTCGNADGSISILVSGSNTPYTYLWTGGPSAGGSTNDSETGLLPGIYTIEITDASGCMEEITIPLGTTNGPQLTVSSTDESCFGLADGTGSVVATGNSPFNYDWDMDGTGDNDDNASESGLSQGQYFVSVTDALGCVSNGSVQIDGPDELILGLPTVQDASCAIACDGEATVIVSGGTLGYTYTWDGGQSSQTATGLCVGVNNINITDANGCEIQTSVNVDFNNQLSSSVVEVDAACGLCDGEATVTGAGGSGNYTINWYDGTTGTSHTDLCAGIYPYTLLDNTTGCSTDLEATINNIDGPDNDVVVITDVTCNGGADGSADVTVSGGTTPYTYLWVPTGQTTSTLTNVPAGTYNLEVSDSNDCKRVVPVTIADGDTINIDYLATGSNCGASDGSIDLIISGGVTPYTISWSGPGGFSGNSLSETGLTAGIYTVDVTDNNGCTESIMIPLSTTNPPTATISATDVSCFGLADGSVTASGAGLNFEWQDASTNSTLNGLSAGEYFVTATDPGTGCSAVYSGTVEEPDSLALGIQFAQDPLCNGDCNGEVSAIVDGGTLPYTYGWSSSANTTATESALCDGTITLTITDANGCTTNGDVTLTAPAAISIVVDNITDAQCVNSQDGAVDITATGGTGTLDFSWVTNPASAFTSTLEDISGLDPTTYEVTVTDENGCTATETADVDTITIVLANAGLDTAFCLNNCAVLTGSYSAPAVPSYEWNTVPPTSVVSSADTVEVCPTLVGITQMTLTVSVLNCTHTDTVDVEMYPLPVVDAGEDITEVLSTTQTLGGSPTGPTGSSYFWSPSTNFLTPNDTTASNPDIELLDELDYVVFVTDTNGCVNSDTIHVRPIPQIVFPNGFTPNADGVNDDWQIDYIDQFPQSVVEVYNRWGEMLFRSVGYTDRWDGTYNGKDLPVGTYYYIIELNDPLFPETYSGPITIMR